jgi:hypothetical protein
VLYPVFGLLLSPIVAVAAMAVSSVSVIGNALRCGRSRSECSPTRLREHQGDRSAGPPDAQDLPMAHGGGRRKSGRRHRPAGT